MYQKQRKHLSGEVHIQGIIFFQCLGLTTLHYVEEKQPNLDVQTAQMLTCKLRESGGMFPTEEILKIRLSETESESNFMQNS